MRDIMRVEEVKQTFDQQRVDLAIETLRAIWKPKDEKEFKRMFAKMLKEGKV